METNNKPLTEEDNNTTDFIPAKWDNSTCDHCGGHGTYEGAKSVLLSQCKKCNGTGKLISQKAQEEVKGENPKRCNLPDDKLIHNCDQWIDKLCKSGGKAWSLRVPVDFNHDPDMLFTELIRRYNELVPKTSLLQQEVEKLMEELERLVFMIDNGLGWKDMENDNLPPREL